MERRTMIRTADTSGLPGGADIVAFHQACLALPHWPRDQQQVDAGPQAAGGAAPAAGAGAPPRLQAVLWQWIEANHRCNSLLWAEEDLARRTKVSDAEIAANKRNI